MRKVRKFATRREAEDHLALVVDRFKLPRMHTQADLDDGTLVEVGGGRHVPPEKIVKEPAPLLRYALSGKWAVEATPSEEADETLGPLLEEKDTRLLVEPDEAPVKHGGKGFVRNEDGELGPRKKKSRKEGNARNEGGELG